MFHVCNLKIFLGRGEEIILLKDVRVDASNWLIKDPIMITGYQTRMFPNKEIDIVLVKWKHSLGLDQPWEKKEDLRRRFHHLAFDEILMMKSS